MEAFIFNNMTCAQLKEHYQEISEAFSTHGVVVFPGLLKNDPFFLSYLADLNRAMDHLLSQARIPSDPKESLDIKLGRLAKVAPEDGKFLADLGTQPSKLVSGNRLKFRPEFISIAQLFLGENSLLGTPASGDTLHLFPPSEKFFKYNLPIHQDYQYLMQSPDQITFWVNIGKACSKVGGVTFWLGSHREGITKSLTNERGQFECVIDEAEREKYRTFDLEADEGDVAIMHSLIWHRSNENQSERDSRIVQLFRFSDLESKHSLKFKWQSTTYSRPSLRYEAAHNDLFVRT
jgi:ectoine hydroxylase-related dioxygenase (phytanoyl-CoA dioxygenase family)